MSLDHSLLQEQSPSEGPIGPAPSRSREVCTISKHSLATALSVLSPPTKPAAAHKGRSKYELSLSY